MNKETNRPPLILILLILTALLVVLTYVLKVTDTSLKRPTGKSTDVLTTNSVSWQNPKEQAKINIFGFEDGFKETKSSYTIVGKVTNGKYEGGDIVLYALAPEDVQGPAQGMQFYHFVHRNGEWFWITPEENAPTFTTPTKFTIDSTFTIPGLAPAEYLTGPKGELFQYQQYVHAFFPKDDSALVKVFTDPHAGDVYRVVGKVENDPYGVFSSNGFYVRLPDGTTAVYSLVIPFAAKNGSVHITWNDGTVNLNDYSFTDRTGCGSVNFAAVETTVALTDLKTAGKASNGDTIYELKDTNSSILKNMYTQFAAYKGISYGSFLASHPLIFWYDSFGRLIRMSSMQFIPQAECGKPVIYLYPQETMNVNVKVSPVGGFSYTLPAYDPHNGWTVRATPESILTDLTYSADTLLTGVSSGSTTHSTTYPYLFWEGRGGLYRTPQKGFVVKANEVHHFLIATLHKLGLNQKETSDFIEFWEPRMKGAPYYFITFLGNNDMNALAPLTVTPRPDTVIRILMDFEPLNEPRAVEGYVIHTPERKGFTVVEWGGVLRGESQAIR